MKMKKTIRLKAIRMTLIAMALFTTSEFACAQQNQSFTIRIKGMRCDDCAHKVMDKLTKINGVDDIQFNLERRTATISYNPEVTCEDSIKKPLIGTRYNPTSYSASDIIMRGYGQHMEIVTEADAQKAIRALQGLTGIDSLAPHLDKHYLFIRYDANRTDKATIRRALIDSGFTPTNYYSSSKIKFALYQLPAEQATSATEENVLTINGVDDATINVKKQTLAITYFIDQIGTTTEKLEKDLQVLGLTFQRIP